MEYLFFTQNILSYFMYYGQNLENFRIFHEKFTNIYILSKSFNNFTIDDGIVDFCYKRVNIRADSLLKFGEKVL